MSVGERAGAWRVLYSIPRVRPPPTSRFRQLICALAATTATVATSCHSSPPPAKPSPVAGASAEERVVYCAEVSDTNMRWTCWGEVTAEIAARRARTVKVVFRGERRISAEIVNGHGALIHGDAGKYVYDHDEQGRPIGETISDAFGVVREKRRYPADGSRTARLDARGEPATSRGDDDDWTVERHVLDAQGRRLRTLYTDETGAPRSTDGRTFEVRFADYGDKARAAVESIFDAAGRPTEDARGVHRTTRVMSSWGATEERTFGLDGAPARASGQLGWRIRYDAIGNVLWRESLDGAGDPAQGAARPARIVYSYDEHGNIIEERRFTDTGSPSPVGAAITRRVFDERGRPTSTAYLDADGHPSKQTTAARLEMAYDAAGALVETRYFRADGQPGQAKAGAALARTVRTYDDRHNLVALRHFNAAGRPGQGVDGISSITYEIENDRVVDIERRNADGGLTGVSGVAQVQYKRDRAGRIVGRRCWDVLGLSVETVDYLYYSVGFVGSQSPTAATRSREEARARADRLLAAARSGSFVQAGARFADNPDMAPSREVDVSSMSSVAAAAIVKTPVGQLTEVLEMPFGFAVMRRDR